MGLMLRKGEYGDYWGNDFHSSNRLTDEQQKVNARYILKALGNKGFTLNAVCGMLANMQDESYLNPGCWQNHNVGRGPGYGLVQWDNFTKYTNWCSGDPSTMDNNISRIIYELDHGLQYIKTKAYPLTFKEFSRSTLSPSYLCVVFLRNYERAGAEHLEKRKQNAENWFNYLKGSLETPEVPVEPPAIPILPVPQIRVQNTRKWLMSRAFRVNIKIRS